MTNLEQDEDPISSRKIKTRLVSTLKIWDEKLGQTELNQHEPRFSGRYVFWTSAIAALLLLGFGNVATTYLANDYFPMHSAISAFFLLAGIWVGASWMSAKYSISSNSTAETQIDGATDNAQQSSEDGWDSFDPDDPKYPEELDIALQAWRAVSNSKKGGTVKEQLSSWVRNAYPQQSAASIERITTIANWDKSGGRPRQS